METVIRFQARPHSDSAASVSSLPPPLNALECDQSYCNSCCSSAFSASTSSSSSYVWAFETDDTKCRRPESVGIKMMAMLETSVD